MARCRLRNEIAGPDGGAREPHPLRGRRRRRDPTPTKGTAEGCGTHHHLGEITHPPQKDGHVLSPAQPKGPPGEEPGGRVRTSHTASIPETRERPPSQAPCSGLLGGGSQRGDIPSLSSLLCFMLMLSCSRDGSSLIVFVRVLTLYSVLWTFLS